MKKSPAFPEGFRALIALALILVGTSLTLSQTNPRKFYSYDIVATSDANLSLFEGPSINDFGDVAFSGTKTSTEATVFRNRIGQSTVELFARQAPQWAVNRQVQINNSGHILAKYQTTNTSPIQHSLLRITGVNTSVLIASSALAPFNDFSSISDNSFAMNGDGESVFVAQSGGTTPTLRSGERPLFSTLSPATSIFVSPAITDFGDIVSRAGSTAASPLMLYDYNFSNPTVIANSAAGFTAIGQSPGISTDFAEVITFYGNLNQAGATAVGTNPGPGIFASIEIDAKKGTRKIIRLTGRLIEDNAAPGGNDDGICDAGETCIQGELGFNLAGNPIFFTGYDDISRIAVAHQSVGAPGIEDDIFIVSFIAVTNIASDRPERPFSNRDGIWTLTTQIKRIGGVLKEQVGVALPVIQWGDVVAGRTITVLGVYDQIASVRDTPSTNDIPGGHRLAFYAGSNTGNMIIRASQKVAVPVIFIPGVGGSVLGERSGSTFTERWPGGLNANNYPFLSLAPGEERDIAPLDVVKRVQVFSALSETVYEELLLAMTSGPGGLTEYQVSNNPGRRTVEGCDLTQAAAQPNLFVFAYDWRKSNSENAGKLRSFIQCIQRFYPGTEVDIVAHSMGGLLARNYINSFQNNHSVRKMVTIGSPFLGAPRMLDVLEEGNFFELEANFVTALKGLRLTGANRIFKELLPHLKGPHELLPSERYFQLGGLPFSERFDFNGDGQITTYNYLTAFNTFNSRFPTLPYTTNSTFHSAAQDDWSNDASGVEYYHLFGRQIGKNTPEQIIAKRKIFSPRVSANARVKFEVKKGIGDKTVPVLSAERRTAAQNLNAPNVIPQACFPALNEDDNTVEHTELTKNPRVQQRVFSILGLIPQTVADCNVQQRMEKTMTSEPNGVAQRESNYLSIDGELERLIITDDLGNTNTQINENFELSLPNVDYKVHHDGSTDGWYSHDLTLTTLRQFTIKFRTGTNPINILDIELIRGYGNDSPSQAVRYLDLELPPNVDCLLTINAQGMEDLRYDSNGDGTFDTVVPAHVRVTGAAAQDVTAPAVTLTYSKRTGGSGRVININATDSQSGVKTIYYRVGETGSFKVYDGPFTESVITEKVIEAFADDNVGNRSSPIRVVVPKFATFD